MPFAIEITGGGAKTAYSIVHALAWAVPASFDTYPDLLCSSLLAARIFEYGKSHLDHGSKFWITALSLPTNRIIFIVFFIGFRSDLDCKKGQGIALRMM